MSVLSLVPTTRGLLLFDRILFWGYDESMCPRLDGQCKLVSDISWWVGASSLDGCFTEDYLLRRDAGIVVSPYTYEDTAPPLERIKLTMTRPLN